MHEGTGEGCRTWGVGSKRTGGDTVGKDLRRGAVDQTGQDQDAESKLAGEGPRRAFVPAIGMVQSGLGGGKRIGLRLPVGSPGGSDPVGHTCCQLQSVQIAQVQG